MTTSTTQRRQHGAADGEVDDDGNGATGDVDDDNDHGDGSTGYDNNNATTTTTRAMTPARRDVTRVTIAIATTAKTPAHRRRRRHSQS
jgi:hypothetical protein